MSDVPLTFKHTNTHTRSLIFNLVWTRYQHARVDWSLCFTVQPVSGSMKCVNLSIERIFERWFWWAAIVLRIALARTHLTGTGHSPREMIVLCDEWILKSEIIPFSLQPNGLIGHAHWFYRQFLCCCCIYYICFIFALARSLLLERPVIRSKSELKSSWN